MAEAFHARLEACDPAKGHFRSYRLDAGTDLFGAWLVDVTFGRIGTPGRRIRHVVANAEEAQKLIHLSLRRRSTARRRIGTGYRFLELLDPHGWFPVVMS